MMRLFSGTIEVGFDRDGFAKPPKATQDWLADYELPDMSGPLSLTEQVDFGVIKKNHMELVKKNARSLASVITNASWQSTATSDKPPRVIVSGPLDGGYYNTIRRKQTRGMLKRDKQVFVRECLSSMRYFNQDDSRKEEESTEKLTNKYDIYLGLDFADGETVLEERKVKASNGGGGSMSELGTRNAGQAVTQTSKTSGGLNRGQWRRISSIQHPRVRVRPR
jgi:hypothetical protein